LSRRPGQATLTVHLPRDLWEYTPIGKYIDGSTDHFRQHCQ
jgi:hypothetical protein